MKHLYARLAVVTSILIITGYLIASAAWTPMTNDATSGSQLTAAIWNNLIGNINDLDSRVTGMTGCQGATIGTLCGGGKYAGGGIVAMTSDESSLMSWTGGFAACLGKSTGGFTDWRIPNQEELRILYENRSTLGGFNTTVFPNRVYWTSNETLYSGGTYYVVWLDFSTNSISGGTKDTLYSIRCIRKY